MSNIINHPAYIMKWLCEARLNCMQGAARLAAKGDYGNRNYCQGKASGLNDAIVLMGGEGISLAVADYMPESEAV